MDDPDKWDKDNIGHLRSDRRREYEKKKPSRRSDSPAWVHDKHPKSEEESVASGQDYLTDLANRLDRLRNEPEVRQKLNQVLMDAYEAKYNDKIEVEPKEDEETEGFDDEEFKDRPKNDEKPHWETHPGEIMPFKVLHESTNLDIPVDYFFRLNQNKVSFRFNQTLRFHPGPKKTIFFAKLSANTRPPFFVVTFQ